MSRFTQFIHDHFGTGAPGETAADIIVRHIPDTAQLATIKEIVSDAVAVMEGTGISGDEKKKLVTVAVNFALGALHVNVPASIVSFLIEEAVLLLKGGKPSTQPSAPPVIVQAPTSDATTPRYKTLEEAKSHVTPEFPTVVAYSYPPTDIQLFGVWNAQFALPPGAVVVYP